MVSIVDAVDGDDRVAVVELLGARDVLGTALPVDVEAQQLLDLHRPRDQLGVVAGQCEGDVLGDLTRRPHHLQVDRAPLRRRLRAVLLLVGDEADLRSSSATHQPSTDCAGSETVTKNTRPSGSVSTATSAPRSRVGHPVGDWLHRRRDDGVGGRLADRPAVAFDLLAGDEAGRQQRRDDDRDEREHERQRPVGPPTTGCARRAGAAPPDRLGRRRERQWRH